MISVFSKIKTLHLVFISAIVFIIYLLLISYYLRPATDDYCLMYLDKQFGWWGTYVWNFQNHRGTVGSLVFIPVLRAYNFFKNFLPVHIVFFTINIGILFLLARNLINQKQKVILPLAAAIFLFIFSILPQADFSFVFWTSTLSAYYLNIVSFQLLLLAIFFIKKNQIAIPVLIISAYYSFSSIENFACSSLFILFLLIIYFWNSPFIKKLVLAFFLGVTALIIIFFSPGTAAYQAKFIKPSIAQTFFIWQKEFYSFFFWTLPKTITYYFFLIPVMVYLGNISGVKILNKQTAFKFFVLTFIFTILLIYVSVLPNVYAMGRIGDPRTYSNLYYYFTVYLSVVSFLSGTLINNNNHIVKTVAGITAFVFLLNTADYIRLNIPELKRYSISYDHRMQLIEQNKITGKEVLVLPKLYSIAAKPFPVYHDILTADSTQDLYWINGCLEKSMSLKFKVYEER